MKGNGKIIIGIGIILAIIIILYLVITSQNSNGNSSLMNTFNNLYNSGSLTGKLDLAGLPPNESIDQYLGYS